MPESRKGRLEINEIRNEKVTTNTPIHGSEDNIMNNYSANRIDNFQKIRQD